MARFLINPTFSIETGELLSHDGESFEEPKILFDRGVQKSAGQANKTATGNSAADRSQASQVYGSVVPGLEQAANNPTGYAPTDINNMLTASQEAVGGGNAAVTGEGKLAALRTRNAGGFAPALDEASRIKGRTLATNALGVSNANAQLKQQQQQTARNQLLGLYGTQSRNALAESGLANQDLETQLAGGRQGWLQNTEGVINTLGNLGKNLRPPQ
jgi:hypothetical protein